MSTNYQKSVIIDSDRDSVFRALTEEIPYWWSTINGSSSELGTEFRVSFGEDSFWEFKVENIAPKKRLEWRCINSHQDHHLKGMDSEWVNTLLIWDISDEGGKTKVDFMHQGLETDGICYGVCSKAWDFYILDSLKSYLETGTGFPGAN